MADLLNTETNQLENVEPDLVHNYLSSGKYDLPKGSLTDLVNPDGEMVQVPAEQTSQALTQYGYRFPSSQEVTNFQKEKLYGEGSANSLKAFAYGAARGASFGLSDQAMTQTGFESPEALKELQDRHGFASTAGEVSGIAGSLLAVPGGGLVGAAAKTGLEAEKAIAPFAAKAAEYLANPETSAMASEVIQGAGEIGAKAIGSAVEGAAYGLGQSVSEDALGDPNLNAEKVLSNVGLGAILGGGIGGALGFAEKTVPKAFSAARQASSDFYDYLVGTPEGIGPVGSAYARASSFVSGKPYEDIINGIQNRWRAAVTPEQQVEMASSVAEGLQDQLEKVGKALSQANKEIRPEETGKLLEGFTNDYVVPEFQKQVGAINDAIKTMREEPDLYPQSYPRILEQIRDRVSKEITNESSAKDVFNSLNDLKSRLDEEISYGAAPSGGDQRAESIIKGIRRDIKEGLEDEKIWGQSAARQASFNEAQAQYLRLVNKQGDFMKGFLQPTLSKSGMKIYEVAPTKVQTFLRQINSLAGEQKLEALTGFLDSSKNVLNEIENSYKSLPDKPFDKEAIGSVIQKNQDFVQSSIEQTKYNKSLGIINAGAHNVPLMEGGALAAGALGHPALGAAIESWNMLKAPGLAIQRLAKIEKTVNSITNSIESASSLIFKGTTKAIDKTKGLISEKITHELNKDKHKQDAKDLHSLNNDPQKMFDTIHSISEQLGDHAPKTAQALQMKTLTAAQFLQSKIPVNPNPSLPMDREYIPSDAELSKFQRYEKAIENPVSVLHGISSGFVSPEEMEAINTVYPGLYNEMKESIMDKLTSHISKNRPLPYKTRLGLSMFLGQDLDSSLSQTSIASNQASLAGIAAQNAAQKQMAMNPVKSTQKGLGTLDISGRIETTSQANAHRERA